jgi:putative ABC transport system substrate-binding protein
MRRREMTVLLAGIAAGSWIPLRAERASRIWRVGYLSPAAAESSLEGTALLEGLRSLGYVEGRNLVRERRYAEGHFDRLPALARELVALRPDVIVTVAVNAAQAAADATASIPIVFIGVSQPVERGLISSLARPGRNLTGLSYDAGPSLSVKQLEHLVIALPNARRIAALLQGNLPDVRIVMEAAARDMGLYLQSYDLNTPPDLDAALDQIARQPSDALLVSGTFIGLIRQKEIIAFSARHRLPAIYLYHSATADGGLMSYGPDVVDLFRRTAVFIDKIFKGASPSLIPVEQPSKFELVVNLKTAKTLGLELSASLLTRADRVIE